VAQQSLIDLPNIGTAIAADLRAIGVLDAQQLAVFEPLTLYRKLAIQMGKRHDPCVLYTLLAVQHFLHTGEKLPWWQFTEQGKTLLAAQAG
jgi:Pathogenicity locus